MRHYHALPEEIREALQAAAITGTLGLLFTFAGARSLEPSPTSHTDALRALFGPAIMLITGLATMYAGTLFLPGEPADVRQLIQPRTNNHQPRLLNTQLLLHSHTPMARERTMTCPRPTSRRP